MVFSPTSSLTQEPPQAGAAMFLALRCFAMARLLAKCVALIAIYAIVLQALLLGYLHAANVGFDSIAVICADGGSNEHDRPLSPHGGDCDRCLLACHGVSPAVIPPTARLAEAPLGRLARPSFFWVELLPLPKRHQPQASRAPPTSV
jgi:hypothetical protein